MRLIQSFALCALLCGGQSVSLFAQGDLTPTNAPAPMMKTLLQIEPRTDVSKVSGDANSVIRIAQPGAYYLTTNILGTSGKHGINIASSDVTLDLNGFTVQGVLGSKRGVNLEGTFTNITLRNGQVNGWGEEGVDFYTGGLPRNLLIEQISAYRNGKVGIGTGGPSVVRDCQSISNGLSGIISDGGVISGCTASFNAAVGIYGRNTTIGDCQARNNNGAGIYSESGVVRDCVSIFSGTYGIYAAGSMVSGCFVRDNTNSGIYINLPGSVIVRNRGAGNNRSGNPFDAGIYINDGNNRVEDNHFTASGHSGIKVNPSYVNNVIIKNTVSGNTNVLANNYIVTGNNTIGPLISAYGTITNSNPWANFSY